MLLRFFTDDSTEGSLGSPNAVSILLFLSEEEEQEEEEEEDSCALRNLWVLSVSVWTVSEYRVQAIEGILCPARTWCCISTDWSKVVTIIT